MGLKYLGLKFKLFAAVLAVPITFLPLRPAAAQQGAPVVLPTIAVSPTLIPTPAAEVASSVTVITGEEIARMQRRTVTDVLMTVPGLNVVQSGSPGTLTAIFIRGTNSYHTKVLIDGMEVGDPSTTNGAIDLGHLMAYDIERIEILRGPQSGLYGSDAIGGVISITTKKGNGPAKVSGYVEGGSFGTFNQAMTLSGSFDRFDYAFNVAHYHYSNQPVTPPYMVPPGASAIGNAYDNWTASTRLGAQVNENLRFNFIGRSTNAKLLYSDDDPSAFPGLTFPEQSTYRNREFHGRLEAVLTLLDGRFVNTFGANYTNFNRSNKDPDPNPLTTFSQQPRQIRLARQLHGHARAGAGGGARAAERAGGDRHGVGADRQFRRLPRAAIGGRQALLLRRQYPSRHPRRLRRPYDLARGAGGHPAVHRHQAEGDLRHRLQGADALPALRRRSVRLCRQPEPQSGARAAATISASSSRSDRAPGSASPISATTSTT